MNSLALHCTSLLLFFGFLDVALTVVNVTILIHGMWKPPYLQALPFTAPGFEMAASVVNEKYGNILNFQISFVSPQSVLLCPDISASYYVVAKRYYSMVNDESRVLSVFYPGCDSSTTLADFGREWNLLTVNTGPTFSNSRNRSAYPTAIAFGPSQYEIYGVMVGQLTGAYNWTSIAILYDISGTTVFHRLVGQEILQYMRKNYEYIAVHAFPVDTREAIDFQAIIGEISMITRVVFMAMPSNFTQLFLLTFNVSRERQEEYVHIQVDFSGSPGNMLDYNFTGRKTEVTAALWQSVFIVAICFEHDESEIVILKRKLKERAVSSYNATFRPNSEPSEHVITAYTSILLYAQVLNETITLGQNPRNGRVIAGSMLNRNFGFPVVGSAYIDQYGERQNTICLYNFQPDLQRFERVSYFDSATQRLRPVPNVTIHWKTKDNLPPANEPVCGFRQDKPPCAAIGTATLAGMISGILAVVVLLLFSAVLTFLRMQRSTADEDWWIVDLHHLSRTTESSRSKTSTRSHRYSFQTDQRAPAPATYRSVPVWVNVIQISRLTLPPVHQTTIHVSKEFRFLLAEIRTLQQRCSNINRLIGIALEPFRLTYISALCERGNLCELIEEVSLDWGLKCSLIADIVEGVSEIHRTVIRRHGHLRPTQCLIDRRLVVKISEVGFYDILSALQVEGINSKNFTITGYNTWVAPELRVGLNEGATYSQMALQARPSADVYAVGGLINYLLQDHTQEQDDKTQDFAYANKSTIPPRAVTVLTNVLNACRNAHPADRPSIWQVKMEINRVMENPGNLLEKLLKRLEDYAIQLESAVCLRTQTLKQEIDRCDSLLEEMLPRYVLVQLRIGHLVQPQLFHSVTLLMTNVAGFDEFVIKSQSNPLEIVVFLNGMFTLFDRSVVKYDCYKVETITDCCLVASGLPVENSGEHVNIIATLSIELREAFERAFRVDGLRLKAGIHTGPCAAGVVGTTRPRYCVFGDSVNITSRLGYSSQPGKIHISHATEALLGTDPEFKVDPRGMTYLKGIGAIQTFWLSA